MVYLKLALLLFTDMILLQMNECDQANGEHGEGIMELAIMSFLENLVEITCFSGKRVCGKM